MRTLHKNAVYSVNHLMMIGNLLSEGGLSVCHTSVTP